MKRGPTEMGWDGVLGEGRGEGRRRAEQSRVEQMRCDGVGWDGIVWDGGRGVVQCGMREWCSPWACWRAPHTLPQPATAPSPARLAAAVRSAKQQDINSGEVL